MVSSITKEEHIMEQKKLLDIIAVLEKDMIVEDETNGCAIKNIEKMCIELEHDIQSLQNTADAITQEQYLERLGEKKKQEKKIELADKLIIDLRKENKRYLKQKVKVQEKINKIESTSERIESMSNSLSNLYDSISTLNDIHETKYTSLQEEHDQTRTLNTNYKNELQTKQDLYWDVAQSRLEYQKGIAKILTLLQNHINDNSSNDKLNDAAIDITKIALDVENEAKIEMAALDIEIAGTELISNTTYTEVSEKGSLSDDCDAYLEINLAK
jgi:hypothetical protein